jgi:Tol biopolymer transport system component
MKWSRIGCQSGLVLLVLLAVAVLAPLAQAAFPGKNGKIAFTRDLHNDCNPEIYTMNPDGTGQTNVTNAPDSYDVEPTWSADGKTLAFANNRDAFCTFQFRLYTMGGDGSAQTSLGTTGLQPAWSPDGTRLAFAPGSDGISAVNSDGSGLTRLTTPISQNREDGHIAYSYDASPAWSPDGRRIAFSRTYCYYDSVYEGSFCDRADLYVMNPDGTDQIDISNTPASDEWWPDWSPDAKRIVYVLARGCCSLSTMNADGSDVRALTYEGERQDTNPAWSPDGRQIVFSRFRDIYVINVDGTGLAQLTTGAAPVGDNEPSWQPLPGPQRADFKNASQYCKAERDFFGDFDFAGKYGGGANAHGKCVNPN